MQSSTKLAFRAVQIGLWSAALVMVLMTVWMIRSRSGDSQRSRAAESVVVSDPKDSSDNTRPISLEPRVVEHEPQAGWDPNGIQDFALTERSGRTVTKQDLLGRPWAVCFVFTTCAGPCPALTGQMALLQRDLKDEDVRLVTITVDPKTDTPEKLQQYAEHFGADPEKWLFLTGDQDEIYELILESFRMPVKEIVGPERREGWQVMHSTNILHVNAKGVVVGKYNGQVPEEMVKLRRALVAECDELEKVERQKD
ncbi:MAG: SCO family protein [Planctomycetaceae bacterium]